MKTVYLIRHAKSSWEDTKCNDFERELSKKGKKDIKIIGSYMSLAGIKPDLVISSLARRTQATADKLAEKTSYEGKVYYLEELYLSKPKTIIDTISLQSDEADSIFIIGHNPELSEVANMLVKDGVGKIPTTGVVAINLDIDRWDEIADDTGEVEFFIYPKQFKYYMPQNIKSIWNKR